MKRKLFSWKKIAAHVGDVGVMLYCVMYVVNNYSEIKNGCLYTVLEWNADELVKNCPATTVVLAF